MTEKISAEAPASITAVSDAQLEATPGVNLDDRLRQVPGFSLFRRTSSLVANPTTQGISLRGLGSTGASRTLVLWDGVPMNDPFGGWVYWTRFLPLEIETVEVSRGASTSLFGDRALSGSVHVLSRESTKLRAWGSYEGGNRDTHEAGAGIADSWRHAAASVNARAFSTDGTFIVPASVRGPVDTLAGVDFVSGNARVDLFGGPHRFYAKVDMLAEDRANGTTLTHNSTSLGTLSGTYSWQHGQDGLSVTGFHTREEFHASFSAIGAGRKTETLSYVQEVPSQATGGSAFWTRASKRFHALVGADVERDQGTSIDTLFPSGLRIGGGNRLQHGAFGQVDFDAGPVRLYGGLRHSFTGGGDTFLSPSAGAVVGRRQWRARGSVYRSFRAPTLNELYREFRVGNTITRANALLRPETLTGGEVGADWVGESRRLSVTLFRNSLENLITNVTLSTGSTITRQRQNAAAATVQGVEATYRERWRGWSGELSYLYADSRYVTGPRIPQVARQQGSAQVTWSHGGTLVSGGLRATSMQFEDDLNAFVLPGYATLQLSMRQRLVGQLSCSVAVENVLDREYLTGFSPTPGIGAPRLVRVGLRWH